MLVAQVVSVAGNRMALLAIPWFVLQTTGSAALTGVAAAMNTIPVVLTGIFAGPVIERIGYRRTSIAADAASGVTILLIPTLSAAGLLSFPWLLALIFAGALLDAPGETARRALVPELAEAAGMALDRATSLQDTSFRLAQMLGAPVAGVLIAIIGATGTLVVDAVSFGVSAIIVAIGVGSHLTTRATPDAAPYREQLQAAVHQLRRDRLLRSVIVVFVLANMLEAGLVRIVLPVLAERIYDDPLVLGLAVGAMGAGALVGVSGHAWLHGRTTRRKILVPGFALAGAPKLLVVALLLPPVWLVAALFAFGIAMGPVNPISGAMQYELVPPTMRGRIFGFLAAGFVGAGALGALGAGVLVSAIGVQMSLLVGAGIYAIVTLVPFVHPSWRELDDLTPAAT